MYCTGATIQYLTKCWTIDRRLRKSKKVWDIIFSRTVVPSTRRNFIYLTQWDSWKLVLVLVSLLALVEGGHDGPYQVLQPCPLGKVGVGLAVGGAVSAGWCVLKWGVGCQQGLTDFFLINKCLALVTSSEARRLTPNRGRIRAPSTKTRKPRRTPFCIEVALNVNVEAPALLME